MTTEQATISMIALKYVAAKWRAVTVSKDMEGKEVQSRTCRNSNFEHLLMTMILRHTELCSEVNVGTTRVCVDQIENWEEKGPNLEMLQVTRSLFYLTLFPAEFSVSPFKSAGEVVIVIINQPTSQQSSKELGS